MGDESGDLGPVYGAQWRAWATARGEMVDQMGEAVERIRADPRFAAHRRQRLERRRTRRMALPPCHLLFQFYVADGRLSCQLYQRSCDVFLGVPFNMASYALLTCMVAQQTDLEPGDFVWTGGDCHLYLNHLDQVDLQLSRSPLPLPRLAIGRRPPTLFDYRFEDFELVGYESHPHIPAAVAV